jgi:potassium/chloride transporter 4/5/6
MQHSHNNKSEAGYYLTTVVSSISEDHHDNDKPPHSNTNSRRQWKISSKRNNYHPPTNKSKYILTTATSGGATTSDHPINIPTKEEKLDTYNGVFLPCLAQIVGVIFFLRLPTITGQAGTLHTTLIIGICVLSTFVTSLSLSAIASNGTIQAGGPYYIISRTLGVEIGGALGILFYLGTTLGASMHVMGAVETMTHSRHHGKPYMLDNFGIFLSIVDTVPSQVWSLLVMFAIAMIVSVGSKYVTRAANFFLGAVGLSIVSIMVGAVLFALGVYDGSLSEEDRVMNDNLHPNYRPDSNTGVTPTFWDLVALFYPATTGILAGTNRSSKLATPNRSIPKGTIGAIGVTTLLYLFQVWLLGSVLSNEILIYNKLVVASLAFPSPVVAKVGVVTACIGAALQCMAGGPQLLGAIAADDAIPFLKFLTRKKRRRNDLINKATNNNNTMKGIEVVELEGGIGLRRSLDNNNKSLPLNVDFDIESEASEKVEAENSKRAVWFSWGIASLGTLLGNINHITPILTMFYLIMYGGINFCCFLLAWVDSPGFRPQFKYFSQGIALLGFFWCIGLAFVISWQMASLALGLVYVIFKYIRLSSNSRLEGGSSPGADWGEVIDSVKYKLTTAVLARVTGSENFHAKNWIPQVLTVVDTDGEGYPLQSEVVALAAQLQKGKGLNVVISIKDGSFLGDGIFEKSQQCKKTLKKFMEKERLAVSSKFEKFIIIFDTIHYITCTNTLKQPLGYCLS